jgi:class 3 adenylate cyclase
MADIIGSNATGKRRISILISVPRIAFRLPRVAIDLGPVVVDASDEIFGDVPNVAARAQPLAEWPGVND